MQLPEGIWKSKTDHNHNAFMCKFNLTVLTLGFVSIAYMLVLKYDDIDVNTEILLHFVEMFHSICTQLMFTCKRKQIALLAEDADVAFDKLKFPAYNRERCLAILQQERTAFRRVMRVACSAILTVYLSIAVDSCSLINGEKKLPYPSWFPFHTHDHSLFYSLATGFQVLIYVEMLCIDLAVAGLWYATINRASGLLDVVGLTLQDLSQDEGELVMLGRKDGKQTRAFQERFQSCIELHIYIIGLIKDLNGTMGFIFLQKVVVTSQIAICFCGYHVIQAVTSAQWTRLLKYASAVMVFSQMLMLYCASGQKLKDKSEKLYSRLYDCDWYKRSGTYQKSLYLLQTIAKRPLVAGKVLPANLDTFMSSIKVVFSYLNFLLTIKDKY